MPKNDLSRNRPNRSAAYFSREIGALSAHFSRQFCAEPTLFQDIRQKTIYSVRENDTFTLGIAPPISERNGWAELENCTKLCRQVVEIVTVYFQAKHDAESRSVLNRRKTNFSGTFWVAERAERRSNFFSAESRRKDLKSAIIHLCIENSAIIQIY